MFVLQTFSLQIGPHPHNTDFVDLLHSDRSPADSIDTFYKIIDACIVIYVLIKHLTFSGRSHIVKYPASIRLKLQKKATTWRIHRSFCFPEPLASNKKIASQCKSAVYAFQLHREDQLNTSGNTGAFFGMQTKTSTESMSSGRY
jgi:hypothetical protein